MMLGYIIVLFLEGNTEIIIILFLLDNEPSGGKALSIRRGIFHWKNAQKKTDDEQTSKIKQAGKTVEEDRGSRHTTGNEEDNEKEYQGYPKLQDIDLDVFKVNSAV